jgi:VanZ family protein
MRTQQWIPRAVAKWADDNPTFRNFPVFAVIGFLAACAIGLPGKSSNPTAVLAGAVAAGMFGTALEVSQIWLRGRFFDPNDIAWTVSGAFAGALAVLPFFWLRGFFKRDG